MSIEIINILPRLQAMLASPMSHVPNVGGYKLLDIRPDGIAIPLTVCKSVTRCHYLAGQFNRRRACSEFAGWVEDEA